MAVVNFKHVKISGIAGVVPPNSINIDDEIQFYENKINRLERNKKILGLGKRHIVDTNTTTVDLCERAAINLIEDTDIDKNKIESVIFISTSHDYVYPASSCLIQGRLKLSEDCLCYDMSGLACSGYVHALINAHSLIEAGVVKNVLLLCGDIASTYTDRRNRISNMLFGDAGTATFIEYTKEEHYSYFKTGTEGTQWDKLIAPAGGRKLPIRSDIANIEVTDKNGNIWHLWDDYMNGMDVFKFTMDVGPKSINDILKYSQKTIDDIDFFAIHQANGQIVKTVANHSGIPENKYSFETFAKYANCAAASVTTVLLDKCQNKKNVCLCTFGVGLSYGSAVLDFSQTKNLGIKIYEPLRNDLSREKQIEQWIKTFKGESND